MPEKTKPDLFNTALAQLEAIVAELEFADDSDSDELLTDFEIEKINPESDTDLSGLNKHPT